MPKKNKTKNKQPIQEAQVVDTNHNVDTTTNKKQEVFNTTVKIVSTFSDMLNTWKNNKIKRYKKRLIIALSIIGVLIVITLIVLLCLFATKVI